LDLASVGIASASARLVVVKLSSMAGGLKVEVIPNEDGTPSNTATREEMAWHNLPMKCVPDCVPWFADQTMLAQLAGSLLGTGDQVEGMPTEGRLLALECVQHTGLPLRVRC
jgi:hypothetical protein